MSKAANKAAKILVAFLVLTFTPVVASAVAIQPESFSWGPNLTGTQVYFGSYSGDASSGPIKWYVVGDLEAGKVTLWTATSVGNRTFDPVGHMLWSGSDMCHWLNGTDSHVGTGFLQSAFSAAEREAMVTAYSSVPEGSMAIDQTIVLPSNFEMGSGTWGIDQASRAFGDNWWLRTPGTVSGRTMSVNASGSINTPGPPITNSYLIRPAFKLDRTAVIFTSDASGLGSKSLVAAGGGWSAAGPLTGAVKLTLLNSSLSLASVTNIARSGSTITFDYTGATPGETLSAVVLSSSGAVKYYGKLKNAIAASGSASFDVPSGFVAGDTVHIFVEQANEDYETDLASALVRLNMYDIEVIAPIFPRGEGYRFPVETEGYAPLMPITFTISNFGLGAMTDLAVALPLVSNFTLDDSALNPVLTIDDTTTFTIKPNDGLAPGVYTETVTITDSNLSESYTFTIRFTVRARETGTAAIPTLNPAALVLLALVLGGLALRQRRRA